MCSLRFAYFIPFSGSLYCLVFTSVFTCWEIFTQRKCARYHTGTFLEIAVCDSYLEYISQVTSVKWVKISFVAESKQRLTSSAWSETKLALLCKMFDTTEHTREYICSFVNHYRRKFMNGTQYTLYTGNTVLSSAILWSQSCLELVHLIDPIWKEE